MPSVDFSAMDEALREMDEIGFDGWKAKRMYVNGEITLEQLEACLEESIDRKAEVR